MIRLHPLYVIALLLGCSVQLATATPFTLNSSAELRADAIVDWSDYSTTHDAVIPDLHAFTPSDGGTPVKPWAPGDTPETESTVTIWNSAESSTASELSGVSLANSGPGQIYFYLDRAVQGMGFSIESIDSGPVTYYLDCFAFGTNIYFTTIAVESPDGSPVYFGFVDPEARLGVVGLRSSTNNNFLVSNLSLQLPQPTTVDPATLPVKTTVTLPISSTTTYLHQGLDRRTETPATETATEDNNNAYDLDLIFPGLRTGDFIHFEQLGYSSLGDAKQNHLLGLFTRTEVIAASSEFQRVETPLEAGTDFYTRTVSNNSFDTPSNIPQDFRISTSSFVSVPDRARYLLFSLARPSRSASPVQVRISHIEHDVFNQWVAGQGLHGPNAELDSDLDNDGLTLIEEFVFSKDPSTPDGEAADFAFQPNVTPQTDTSNFSLAFGARTDAPIRYWAEFSSDLEQWDRLPEALDPSFINDAIGERALFFTADPIGGPQRFGRIVIDYLPRPLD